jgi:hypothetical protein
MTQEQFDELLEKLETYKFNLDNEDREKEEYLEALIGDFKANEERFLSDGLTLEDWFCERRESQEYADGGYREVMYPDVDEDDQKYTDDYDPYDNDEFRIHSELLDELAEYLELELQ